MVPKPTRRNIVTIMKILKLRIVPNSAKPKKRNNRPKRTSFFVSTLSDSLPATKFAIRAAMEPINKAMPILSKPTSISSAIIGIRGSMIIIENPKSTKIK